MRTVPFDARDTIAAVELLRKIVAAQDRFFDRNENGSHDEFQRAADEYHGAVDEAANWLEARGVS